MYTKDVPLQQIKNNITALLKASNNHSLTVHDIGLLQQSDWLKFKDQQLEPADVSWKTLLNTHPRVLKFFLNAVTDCLPTPHNLRTWRRITSSRCPLCHYPTATLHHILNYCDYSLKAGRFLWRHNSVLAILNKNIQELVMNVNTRMPVPLPTTPVPVCFVKSNSASPSYTARPSERRSTPSACYLQYANDWKIWFDFDKHNVFPTQVSSTNLRPDAIVYSLSIKHIIIMELTCPYEANTADAHHRKYDKYHELQQDLTSTGWTVHLHPFEVSSRGFVSYPTTQMLRRLGFPAPTVKSLSQQLSSCCLRSSYAIFLARYNKSWSPEAITQQLS